MKATVITAEAFASTIDRHYAERGLPLPNINLVPDGTLGLGGILMGSEYNIFNDDGLMVGECTVVEHQPEASKERFFGWIHILEGANYRQRGYGVATYKTAICDSLRAGINFRTDPEAGLSAEAINAWQRLINLGLAVALDELTPTHNAEDDIEGFWHVVVPAGQSEGQL
jgi:hypothetical protein